MRAGDDQPFVDGEEAYKVGSQANNPAAGGQWWWTNRDIRQFRAGEEGAASRPRVFCCGGPWTQTIPAVSTPSTRRRPISRSSRDILWNAWRSSSVIRQWRLKPDTTDRHWQGGGKRKQRAHGHVSPALRSRLLFPLVRFPFEVSFLPLSSRVSYKGRLWSSLGCSVALLLINLTPNTITTKKPCTSKAPNEGKQSDAPRP